MRTKSRNVILAALAVVIGVGFLLTPSAAAQDEGIRGNGTDYVPFPVPVPDCSDIPGFDLIVQDGQIVVVIPEIYLQCVIQMVVEAEGVLYDGPAPPPLILRLPPDGVSCNLPVIATATTIDGVVKVQTLDPIESGLPCTTGVTTAVPLALDPLATTGSNVRLPISVAAALVGAGGIALLVARKREEHVAAA